MVTVRSVPVAVQMYASGDSLEECWEWVGSINSAGYGQHRQVWKQCFPAVNIDKLDLDHFKYPESCIGKRCANPDHLRPATRRENTLRGDTIAAAELAKESCKHGHPFSPENTHYRPSGKRDCVTCRREYDRRRYNDPTRREAMRRANRMSRARKRGDAQ